MNKLEVGMYVRTKCGIAKITDIICGQDVKFDNDSIFEDDDLKQHHRYDGISTNDYFFKHDVVKISHNLIDLIEPGDYVNGVQVIDKEIDNLNEKYLQCGVGDYVICTYNSNEIEDVVTKEQFSAMEYRLGG